MRKEEFLKELERILSEQLPREAVVENIQYYEKYIDSQIQNGRSEQDVMNELGSPHLIAKTIVETSGGIYYTEQESASQMERKREPSFEKQMEQRMRSFQMNCLAVVLVALLIDRICIWRCLSCAVAGSADCRCSCSRCMVDYKTPLIGDF